MGYKRGLVNSLTGKPLQRFGFDKVAKGETLREIIEEMADGSVSANLRAVWDGKNKQS